MMGTLFAGRSIYLGSVKHCPLYQHLYGGSVFSFLPSQQAFTSSELTVETLEQSVNFEYI